MDDFLKMKRNVPSPTAYKIDKGLLIKQNIMNQKSPRTTFNAEIQKIEKKKAYPEPATY